MSLRRINVPLLGGLLARPVRNRSKALRCALCGEDVDYEAVVERMPTAARVLVRHHGAEELATFELGTREWDETDLQRMCVRNRWFDPQRAA